MALEEMQKNKIKGKKNERAGRRDVHLTAGMNGRKEKRGACDRERRIDEGGGGVVCQLENNKRRS